MAALTAGTLNLSLFAVTAAFVLPVGTNIPCNALPVCPLNSSTSSTVIVFLPLMKIFGTFFLQDRSLLNCLFHSVSSVISRMFFNLNHSKNYTPGYIMVLHTFGRDLKWNPHIHCLLSEGGFSDDGFWHHVKHFNYNFLRNAFRTALLNGLENKIGPSFKKVKAKCYSQHKHGFYVYAKPNLCDSRQIHRALSWKARNRHLQN